MARITVNFIMCVCVYMCEGSSYICISVHGDHAVAEREGVGVCAQVHSVHLNVVAQPITSLSSVHHGDP